MLLVSFRDIGKEKAKNQKKMRKENVRLPPVSPSPLLSDENGPGGPGPAGLPGRAG